VDQLPIREVGGQHPPLTTRLEKVENSIKNIFQWTFAIASFADYA
jgi:hypothetical protein